MASHTMQTHFTRLLVAIAVFVTSSALARPGSESITGVVARVIDGDTIHVLAKDKTTVKVRLEGIDAPETGQPFGTKARQALAAKILGKTVIVETKGNDKYGRTLGVVSLDGRNINLEMVSEGWAWHFKKYSKDAALANAENEARAKRAGLWADAKPQSPWDWRAAEKQRRKELGTARPTADPSIPAAPKTDAPTTKPVAKDNPQSDDAKEVVYITGTGRRYHSAGCVYLKPTGIAISFADAKARGLSPCTTCGGHPTRIEDHSSNSAIEQPANNSTGSGQTIYTGPRGGHYHYSASGKKVYERKK
jgi:micrococcal nuclease